ncbi:hypothetical protein M2360_002975 [Rhizobium sp. SG_E_25_P2]|uniref:DUF2867 domain-containing protein n=1 Tax=Rhizobium sp. SG_E_25_P2 TaxID=2879942 RepID=UPI002473E1BD|nr:DUF2867 domain-containing protein [Rhizobium sp. SG_E_25_P2]MDH6267578.1 hypothetical protein [Rhizobium sp. SG_E_25_P2]
MEQLTQTDPLPGADWRDRFEAAIPSADIRPLEAARQMLDHPPLWVSRLMGLRNQIVKRLGLRPVSMVAGARAGGFPVIEDGPNRAVLGFDDRHLDFRIVVDIARSDHGGVLGVTTLVKRNNLLGYVYLAAVSPFHRRIVPVTMAAIGRDPKRVV